MLPRPSKTGNHTRLSRYEFVASDVYHISGWTASGLFNTVLHIMMALETQARDFVPWARSGYNVLQTSESEPDLKCRCDIGSPAVG